MTQLLCITGEWDNVTQRTSGTVEQVVCAGHDIEHYQQHPWVPHGLLNLADTREDAEFLVARTMRVLRFMDVTGLAPFGYAWESRLQDLAPRLPQSADHAMLWQDADGRWIVTVEPYCIEGAPPASLVRWAQSAGWALWRADPRSGMWNPEQEARLLVMAPPASAQGGDVEALCQALEISPREMPLARCLVAAKVEKAESASEAA